MRNTENEIFCFPLNAAEEWGWINDLGVNGNVILFCSLTFLQSSLLFKFLIILIFSESLILAYWNPLIQWLIELLFNVKKILPHGGKNALKHTVIIAFPQNVFSLSMANTEVSSVRTELDRYIQSAVLLNLSTQRVSYYKHRSYRHTHISKSTLKALIFRYIYNSYNHSLSVIHLNTL